MQHRNLICFTCLLLFVSCTAYAKIVFTSSRDGNREIYVMDDDGQNVQRLTNTPLHELHPRWSPDGRKIAFFRGMDPIPGANFDMFIMNADGSNEQRLTNRKGFDGERFSWSPDSKHIAFTSDRSGWPNIYVVKVANKKVRQLTNYREDDDIMAQEADWSPDGNLIAYTGVVSGGGRTIYTIRPNGFGNDPFIPAEHTVVNRVGPRMANT